MLGRYSFAHLFHIEGLGIIALIAFMLANAIFSTWFAAKKGYGRGDWFLLGLILGLPALLAIGMVPKKEIEVGDNEEERA